VLRFEDVDKVRQIGDNCCCRLGVQPHEVYHATVMPCYDKKLEASRNDFRHTLREFGRSQDADTSDGAGVREVDLVLTTTEVLDLMTKPPSQAGTESSSQLAEPSSSAVDSAHASMPGLLGVSAGPGPSIAEGGSGGYAEYIFRSAAKEFHGRTIEGPLEYVQGKNKDWREVVLEVEGKVRTACHHSSHNATLRCDRVVPLIALTHIRP